MNDFSGLLNSDYGFNLFGKSAPMSSSSNPPIFDLGYTRPSSQSTRTFNSFDYYHVQGLNIKGFQSPSRGGTIDRSRFGFWKRSSSLVSESLRDEKRIEDQGSAARVRPNRSPSKLHRASLLSRKYAKTAGLSYRESIQEN
ncbi:hypothetical protein M0R45_018608 [Rubus argutus]|uniref:Uncharacterized protein n=1 Tax=Rubus argutus TaxID=59490 RepID=A0AAW1X5F7_RUBAR